MEKLKIVENQLIPIMENSKGEKLVNAREFHAWLGNKDNFTTWITDRIKQYGFEENVDFTSFSENTKKPNGGRPSKEYIIILDMAKELAMVERNEKGKEARQYFIAIEKKYKEVAQPLSTEDLIIMQAQSMKALKEKVEQVQTQTEILNHRVNNLDCTNIEGTPQQRLNAMVKKYGFMKGVNMGAAWDEFIRRYNTAFHANLNLRKQSYIKRNKIKYISTPDFLNKIGLIEDALRIADKMLNGKVA